MNGPLIRVAFWGKREAFIIAAVPAPDGWHSGSRLVVGDVRRISADGEPEAWRAWLWPVAGGAVHTTRSCEVADARTPRVLQGRLQKRADRAGAWWK